jgi:hypothetical protein
MRARKASPISAGVTSLHRSRSGFIYIWTRPLPQIEKEKKMKADEQRETTLKAIRSSERDIPDSMMNRIIARAAVHALIYLGDQIGRIADAMLEKDTSSDGKKSALDV